MKNKIDEIVSHHLNEKRYYYSNDHEYSEYIPQNTPGYIWRTSEDDRVRESHARMDGKFVPDAHPPTLDNLTGHAGDRSTVFNCRCTQERVGD